MQVGFIYRICLRQQNMLDLVGIGCHNLEVSEWCKPYNPRTLNLRFLSGSICVRQINELPVPRVVTAASLLHEA